MKDSIRTKLETVRDRFEEIAGLLADPEIIANQVRFRELSKEYARVEPVVGLFRNYEAIGRDISAAEEMAGDSDPDVRALGTEELSALITRRDRLSVELQKSLIPADPYDEANVFLEVRAGTGGDEAAIFAGDLFRMYSRYA
jgi:peptide chain release factor 1